MVLFSDLLYDFFEARKVQKESFKKAKKILNHPFDGSKIGILVQLIAQLNGHCSS